MDDSSLWRQLEHVNNQRDSEYQVIWNAFGIFVAATTLLLVALFSGGQPQNPVIGIIITLVGSVLSFIWFKILHRHYKHLRWHENLVQKLEQILIERGQLTSDLTISGYINDVDFKKFVGKGIRVRDWMKGTTIAFVVLWFSGFLFFLIKLLNQ
jgi:hypothetical protein